MVSFCTYSSKIILVYFTISYAIVNDLLSFSNCCQYIEMHFFGILILYPETLWYLFIVVIIQSPSHVWLSTTPWTACSTPGFPVPHHLPEFAQIHVHWIGDASNHLILCRPLLLSSIFPSISVFSSELAVHIRWPKFWSFCFSIGPSKEYSGLISFKMDWFDLDFQGTLKSLL